MGMFDEIFGEVTCPFCGKISPVEDQIKWADRLLLHLEVGSKVNADDGVYTYGSYIRPFMRTDCTYCGTEIKFEAEVKEGIITDIRASKINSEILRLAKIINESKKIVFFGGAGVSTESGIPDFRSKDGLYNNHDVQFDKYDPKYLLSKDCLNHNPKVFFEYYRQKLDVRNIQPNITHKFLAELEEEGKLLGIVTQNIDGLHQKAGNKKVYEIHGTTYKNHCSKCHSEYDVNFIYDNKDLIPRCPNCEVGIVRPDVVLYGEQLPKYDVNNAINIIEDADTLIIAGTSLTVYPAANFISYFKGKHIVVINNDHISIPFFNYENDVEINCGLKDVLSTVKYLREESGLLSDKEGK